jgi:hypothetical protein
MIAERGREVITAGRDRDELGKKNQALNVS